MRRMWILLACAVGACAQSKNTVTAVPDSFQTLQAVPSASGVQTATLIRISYPAGYAPEYLKQLDEAPDPQPTKAKRNAKPTQNFGPSKRRLEIISNKFYAYEIADAMQAKASARVVLSPKIFDATGPIPDQDVLPAEFELKIASEVETGPYVDDARGLGPYLSIRYELVSMASPGKTLVTVGPSACKTLSENQYTVTNLQKEFDPSRNLCVSLDRVNLTAHDWKARLDTNEFLSREAIDPILNLIVYAMNRAGPPEADLVVKEYARRALTVRAETDEQLAAARDFAMKEAEAVADDRLTSLAQQYKGQFGTDYRKILAEQAKQLDKLPSVAGQNFKMAMMLVSAGMGMAGGAMGNTSAVNSANTNIGALGMMMESDQAKGREALDKMLTGGASEISSVLKIQIRNERDQIEEVSGSLDELHAKMRRIYLAKWPEAAL